MVTASVVICTMGTPTRVLECLKKQTFQNFEVIIASEKGIVNAMNLALGRARGEFFVRIDDDVDLPPAWLSELIKPFSSPYVAGVTGPTFVPKELRGNRDSIRMWENPSWFLRWLADGEPFIPAQIFKCGSVSYGSNYEEQIVYMPDKNLQVGAFEPDHLEGTNWAMRTELIRRVGGFDPKFDGVAEWFDTDVESKIKKLYPYAVLNKEKNGVDVVDNKLVYNPNAYLYHLLEKGEHYNDRFDGWGRIKNWLRFHWRHSKFHPKMVIFLCVWLAYFAQVRIKKCFAR